MPVPDNSGGVSLARATQTRNLLLFAGCVGMQYLAAPVLYIGSTHAALLDQLQSSNALANSPEVLYLSLAFTPLLVSSIFRHPSWLKPLLVTAYVGNAMGTVLVVATVLGRCSAQLVSAAVIGQAIVTGASLSTAIALVWEAMGRGVAETRRGAALALAYGVGPILAAVGSLGSQALLTGEVLGMNVMAPLPFPGNFAVVFAAATVPMLVAAGLAGQFVLPDLPRQSTPAESVPREGFVRALAAFFREPILRRAAIAATLIYASAVILANLTLFTREAMGELPSDQVMYQNALRFGTKAVAGLLLGALLAKTHPLAGLLVTGTLCLIAPLYACWATGVAYLVTFQIFGAAELFGVYSPNYVLSASRRKDIRRNLACAGLLPSLAAPFGLLFGQIADVVGKTASPAVGYRASFYTCAMVIGAGLLVATTLPRRPQAAGANAEDS